MDDAVRTAALIPARGGSKGLPGKNLAEINHRSLVARAVDIARSVAAIDEIAVSSDDDEILAEAERVGARPERRPSDLARDDSPTLDVIRAFVAEHTDVDRIVVLQPTSPLRSADDVTACFDALDAATTAVTVTAVEHPLAWSFRLGDDNHLEPVLGWEAMVGRRQDAAMTYRLNGAVYAARADHLRSGGELVGPETVGIVMPRERSVDVDDELDLEWARLLAARSGTS